MTRCLSARYTGGMVINVTDRPEDSARWLGAVLLERHIREKYRTVPAFCEATGLERTYISRLIDGDRGDRMPVQMAAKIETATGGDVPIPSWAQREDSAPESPEAA